MAAPFKSLDITLRDMLKQNLALLELVAYGAPLYPKPHELEREHKSFAARVQSVVGADTTCFVVSGIGDTKLGVFSSFDGADPIREEQPNGDLLPWLLKEASDGMKQQAPGAQIGPIATKIRRWLGQQQEVVPDVYIVRYVVTKLFGEPPLKADVQTTLQSLRNNTDQLNRFIKTSLAHGGTKPAKTDLDRDGYFRAYACVGVTHEWKSTFEETGDFDALMETLMMFYQMSWSNLDLVNASARKSQEQTQALLREREKDAALAYARIQDPIREVVKLLDQAKEPLARLQTVISPVRGLFGAGTMGDDYFPAVPQKIVAGSCEVLVCHDFHKFADHAADERGRIELATRHVAATVLAGLGEVREAEDPIWQYMQFRLKFAEHRRIARMLLSNYPSLGLEVAAIDSAEAEELFEMTKYWFNHAGRNGKPMRADYMIAGLHLLNPEKELSVTADDIKNTDKFYVLSTWPLQTIAGLEALCHDYAMPESAELELTPREADQTARLSLAFGKKMQEILAKVNVTDICEQCKQIESRGSLTRGNMASAITELFGGVPVVGDGRLLTRTEERRGTRATLEFTDTARIVMTWTGPRYSDDVL